MQNKKMVPNKDRKRSEFLHYRSIRGLPPQELADFSRADLERFFRVTLWDKSRICKGCGKRIKQFEDASLDHILPRSMGGRTRLSNLQLMHGGCNHRKGNKVPPMTTMQYLAALTPVPSRSNKPVAPEGEA